MRSRSKSRFLAPAGSPFGHSSSFASSSLYPYSSAPTAFATNTRALNRSQSRLFDYTLNISTRPLAPLVLFRRSAHLPRSQVACAASASAFVPGEYSSAASASCLHLANALLLLRSRIFRQTLRSASYASSGASPTDEPLPTSPASAASPSSSSTHEHDPDFGLTFPDGSKPDLGSYLDANECWRTLIDAVRPRGESDYSAALSCLVSAC